MNALSKQSGIKANTRAEALAQMIQELGHYLPSQPPLHAFVHHNTLHNFEHLKFEDAVVEAASLYQAEPFLSEFDYHQYFEKGRFTDNNITEAITEYFDEQDAERGAVLNLDARDFYLHRLSKFIAVPEAATIEFLLAETDALKNIAKEVASERTQQLTDYAICYSDEASRESAVGKFLNDLWQVFNQCNLDYVSDVNAPKRLRDYLLTLTHIDIDEWIHPILIRLCAAFLDQGISHWPMPQRDQGLWACFKSLYAVPLSPPNHHIKNLKKLLNSPALKNASALETIDWALTTLNIHEAEKADFLLHTLLALRGWAGMIQHVEQRPDRAPVQAPKAELNDFLAIRLLLEVVAGNQTMQAHFKMDLDFHNLKIRYENLNHQQSNRSAKIKLCYEAFIAAQCLPVDPKLLTQKKYAETWIKHIHQLNNILRRRLLHLAFEGFHRNQTLDALQVHSRDVLSKPVNSQRPVAQAVFCIDDREESVRRHLEEILPGCETFGFAGFFGAAIQYQGLNDIRSKPLCPVVITPKHFIKEVAENDAVYQRYKISQKRLGRFNYHKEVSSKTLTRGSIYTALLGWLSIPALILRSISPRLYLMLEHLLHAPFGESPKSRLLIEREHEHEEPLKTGYSIKEMTDIVESTLKTLNIIHTMSNLVFFVGHGSCSLNNPHEAAHDCGATGGGRGGPNARTFAAMANHPLVRQALMVRGINIPDTTWFIGAYHNTCDDAMTYYDEDLLPDFLGDNYRAVKIAFDKACVMDAHERCRRFETTPMPVSPDEALEYAQIHANDLAEPRPEYGHATNSICIVGRRVRSRGLFLDRRSFLVSYDHFSDTNGQLLKNILMAVGPVGAGINLEYYFSFVDPAKYGCGTKLPHNITGLIGVMDGHATDLRTGLPWQMVEIHEPVRLLVVVESTPEQLQQILNTTPALAPLIQNRWIQLAALDPESDQCFLLTARGFVARKPAIMSLTPYERSADYYSGQRNFLAPAQIRSALV